MWESRARRPGPFRPRISPCRGYVGMGTDKGKPPLSHRADPRSSRHERKRLVEPLLLYEHTKKWLLFTLGIDWLGYCLGGRNWPAFCMRGGHHHLVLSWTLKLTWFLCGSSIFGFVWVWGTELELISVYGLNSFGRFVGGPNWCDFLCGCRKWLVFRVWIEITSVSCGNIEIDLMLKVFQW